jgi:phosphinothricin acetyltransferase
VSDSLEIRPASAGDIAEIAAIYRHWVTSGTSSFELEPPDEAEMLRRFQATTGSSFPYLAASLSGRLVGYAYAGAYRPRPAYRFTVEDSIYLAPDIRGRGVGSRLLAALIDRLRAAEYASVIAVVGDPATNAASVALHRRLGFLEFGRARGIGYKFERWLDVAYLQLDLRRG